MIILELNVYLSIFCSFSFDIDIKYVISETSSCTCLDFFICLHTSKGFIVKWLHVIFQK